MANMPGWRTEPTVRSLATMNKKNLRDWDIRLGVWQIVAVIGLVTGGMFCAFIIGHSSGYSRGMEEAMESASAQVPRFVVAQKLSEFEMNPDRITEVYQQLGTKAEKTSTAEQPSKGSAKIEEPELGAIKSLADAPITDVISKDVVIPNVDSVGKQKEQIQEAAKSGELRVLGDGTGAVEQRGTLGSLLKESGTSPAAESKPTEAGNAALQKVAAKPTATPTPTRAAVKTTPSPIKKVAEITAKDKNKATVKETPVKSVAKEPAQTRQPATVAATERVRNGWYAQVSAQESIRDAKALAGQLVASGFEVTIEKAEVRGQEYFRVLVGPEDNRTQVEALKKQLQRERYIKGSPFVRLVK